MDVSKLNSTENITKAISALDFLDKDPLHENQLEQVGNNVAKMGASLAAVPGVGPLAAAAVTVAGLFLGAVGGVSGGGEGEKKGGGGPSG